MTIFMPSSAHKHKSVRVVIVNYNGGAVLTECVRSVLRSTIPVRVFVSDNGSTDNSIAYLRTLIGEHPRLHIVENGRNLGFARANNIVLTQTHSDYVLVLNPDCVLEPDTIEKMLLVMEAHPDAGVASPLILNPDGTEQAGCRRYVPTPWRSLVRVLKLHRLIRNHPRFQSFAMTGLPLPDTPQPVEAVSGAFMLLRGHVIATVGPMDEKYFLHCEDLDWCMRILGAGWKILFVPHVYVVHWKGLSSASHPVWVEYYKHRGMVRFYRKFFRRQYPGLLMVFVLGAVWTRFALKTAWILARNLFGKRDAARVARISVETVERWRKELDETRDSWHDPDTIDSVMQSISASLAELREPSIVKQTTARNSQLEEGARDGDRGLQDQARNAGSAQQNRLTGLN